MYFSIYNTSLWAHIFHTTLAHKMTTAGHGHVIYEINKYSSILETLILCLKPTNKGHVKNIVYVFFTLIIKNN